MYEWAPEPTPYDWIVWLLLFLCAIAAIVIPAFIL